jgi:hypothetical protein
MRAELVLVDTAEDVSETVVVELELPVDNVPLYFPNMFSLITSF